MGSVVLGWASIGVTLYTINPGVHDNHCICLVTHLTTSDDSLALAFIPQCMYASHVACILGPSKWRRQTKQYSTQGIIYFS
jgi:hypothetical protein